MFNKVLLLILTLTFSSLAHAKTVEIEMLNKLGKEKMLYSVKVAEVDVNDKIIWKSKTKGHNVEFVVMPKGVKKFKSKINKDATYEFKVPGIYLYQCTPHKAMGMIGIVVVGNDKSNLDAVKKAKMRGKSKKVLKELLKGI
ncbi:plastocyanin/azurin family copper-binding protein [Alphaproteobacteria bacterium]|jgi:pseudoazurin|nr:plastocyanin/azurin family copper-binding protein [Alphaproteobacteria bacterium]